MLTSVCDDGYPVHVACKHSSVNVVNFLTLHGSPVDAFDSHSDTPLMVCCREDRCQLVLSLLDAGANPNVVSHYSKRSALHLAVQQCDLQSTWLLLQYGGDQRIGDSLSMTPRQIAQQQLTKASQSLRKETAQSGDSVSSGEVQRFQELMDSLDFCDGESACVLKYLQCHRQMYTPFI